MLAGALAAALAVVTAFSSRHQATLPRIPKYAQPYKTWHKVNRKPVVRPRGSLSDAHFGRKNIYASKKAVRTRYSYGSILVKEGVRSGEKFVSLIAIMRKTRGSDPKHGDWQWVEYTRGGAREPFTKIASGSICYGCHVGAKKTDWVFTTR